MRTHRHHAATGRERLPERMDPAGVPVAGVSFHPSDTMPRHEVADLPGVSAESVVARVEGMAHQIGPISILWASIAGRPILFGIDTRSAQEMLEALADGEEPVAIVEPWQIVGESLD
jgi:hypothetical protein